MTLDFAIKLGKNGGKGAKRNNGKITEVNPLLFRNNLVLKRTLRARCTSASEQANYRVDSAYSGFFVENFVSEGLTT